MTVNERQAARRGTPCPLNLLLSRALVLVLQAWLWAGCASTNDTKSSGSARSFNFSTDTFSYANGLVWEYEFDANGKWTSRRREPRPSYSQHCFVVSRSACQFFENARFDTRLPKANADT